MGTQTRELQPAARDRALALVAMPWSFKDRPSAALSALAAYTRRSHPEWRITCHSEFMHVAHSVGHALYDHIANATYSMGELFYMPLVYPERRDEVLEYFAHWAAEHIRQPLPGFADWSEVGAHVLERLARELASSAERLAGKTIVGLTTCFGQMFANVALSRAIKALHPETLVVLGGSTVSSRVGPSVLSEYGSIDYIIQGEGEEPLSRLLSAVERGENPGDLGIVSRDGGVSSRLTEIANMDDLPLPDFDEYAELAERYDVAWTLPIEGSRGCWWDRTARTGNPKSICYFCNLNVQWNGYREKSIARVTREVDEQTSRYENLRVFFLDNIIRHKGADALARSLADLKKDFNLFYEMRANMTPLDMVQLWEAGLRVTQFGIEGLSTSFLKRIGKGTTAIQNLEAMRMCTELRITNNANLIINFPGATAAEVADTASAIDRWALGFKPLTICPFFLGVDSSIDRLREEFGITNVRNRDLFKIGLPDDVWRRLELFDLDFDLATPSADWSGVVAAQARWQEAHARQSGLLLYYQDGGSFLVVEDFRSPSYRQGRFNRLERDVYLHCTQVRRLESILAHAARRNGSESDVKEILAMFVEADIMAVEGDRYLSLAVATSPHLAARRIREQETSDERPRSIVRMAVLQ